MIFVQRLSPFMRNDLHSCTGRRNGLSTRESFMMQELSDRFSLPHRRKMRKCRFRGWERGRIQGSRRSRTCCVWRGDVECVAFPQVAAAPSDAWRRVWGEARAGAGVLGGESRPTGRKRFGGARRRRGGAAVCAPRHSPHPGASIGFGARCATRMSSGVDPNCGAATLLNLSCGQSGASPAPEPCLASVSGEFSQ